MLIKRLFYPLLVVSVVSLLFISCNSKLDKSQDFDKTEIEEVSENLSKQDTIHILLQSNDKMQFDKTEIVVYKGQTVVLTLKHIGSMPKTAMGHNFVLLNNSVSISDYAKLALKSKNNEYIPEDPELTIVHTGMIGGVETAEITFKAPESGIYDFICSFPGHYSNMKGKFIVK